MTAFTITGTEEPVHPDHPAETHVLHTLSDKSGPVAVGMQADETLAALAARGHADDEVLVRAGALGREKDERATIGALLKG